IYRRSGGSRCGPEKPMTPTGYIAYVVQRFPTLRTTFIRREIEALRELGLNIHVFSMRPADRGELDGEDEARAHAAVTHYLPASPLTVDSFATNVAAWIRRPAASTGNWSLAFGDPGRGGPSRR